MNEYKREYNKKKIKINPGFRILCSLRARLGIALREQNARKSKHSMKLIGCSIDKLKKHLESKFLLNMSWDNYGKNGWHIDHIKPCTSFDLTDPEQQQECFHYSNLQPLWAEDNLSKSSYYKGRFLTSKNRKTQ